MNLSKVKSNAPVTKFVKTFVACVNEAVKISLKLVIASLLADTEFNKVVTSSGVLPSARAR